MKHFLCTLFLPALLLPALVNAQENSNKYTLSVKGFVRADAIFDSRQVLEAREGFVLFYPKKPVYDAEGNDLMAQPTFNQYAMTTRLTAVATGPDILGAKLTALLEGDFTGASNAENNSMRLRHAYISMKWSRSRLLIGQYWHPLDVPEMIPNVLALNTGAPFHSFCRQPQVRFDYTAGKFTLVAVAASQRDYVNTGPSGNSSAYLRNSVVPNLHTQVLFRSGKLFAGLGYDFKRLTPRLVTDSLFKADEGLNTASLTAFASYTGPVAGIKAQVVYGQALNDHLMMGGYAVKSTDESTNRRTYIPLNYFSAWINIARQTGTWQPSVFAGYTQNTGTRDEATTPVYARDADIAYVYRVSPMITYVNGRLNLIAELEITTAAYGRNNNHFRVTDSRETTNVRIGIGAVYAF